MRKTVYWHIWLVIIYTQRIFHFSYYKYSLMFMVLLWKKYVDAIKCKLNYFIILCNYPQWTNCTFISIAYILKVKSLILCYYTRQSLNYCSYIVGGIIWSLLYYHIPDFLLIFSNWKQIVFSAMYSFFSAKDIKL